LGSKKPGPPAGPQALWAGGWASGSRAYASESQVRDQWLCPYKSTGVMEYWSVGVLI